MILSISTRGFSKMSHPNNEASYLKKKIKHILKSDSSTINTSDYLDVENIYTKDDFFIKANEYEHSITKKETLIQSNSLAQTSNCKGKSTQNLVKTVKKPNSKKRKMKHNSNVDSNIKSTKILTKNLNNQGVEMIMAISNIIQTELIPKSKFNSQDEIVTEKIDNHNSIVSKNNQVTKSLGKTNDNDMTTKKSRKCDLGLIKKSTKNIDGNINRMNNHIPRVFNSEEIHFNLDSSMTKSILKKIENKRKRGIEQLFEDNDQSSWKMKKTKTINENYIYEKSAVEVLKNSPKTPAALSKILYTDLNNEPAYNAEIEEETNSITESILTENEDPNFDKMDLYQETIEINNVPFHSFLIESGFCVALFKAPSKVYFCGKLKASVLYGDVTVHGHKLNEIPQDLYSVCSSSLLSFETCETIDDIISLSSKLGKLGLSTSNIQLVLEKAQTNHSILLLKPLNNTLTDFVNQHVTDCNLFTKSKEINIDIEKEAFKLLQCTFYNGEMTKTVNDKVSLNDLSELLISPDKNHLTNKITMLCGGKNSGKSTTLRHLINKSLKDGPVLVLDFDPGQPEFTICGLLSATLVQNPLLGPNFTHLAKTDRSLCFGSVNVLQNENRYLNCVRDLVGFCKSCENYIGIPWIINTIGCANTLGLKLLISIIDICKPNILIELLSLSQNNNYEIRLSSENVNNFNTIDLYRSPDSSIGHEYDYHLLDPYQSFLPKNDEFILSKHVEAKTERLLNVLAYFSQMVSVKCCSILNTTPYTIPLDDVELYFNNLSVEEPFVLGILNGRIIALCEDKRETIGSEGLKIFKYENDPSVCHGYGIIRGVDVERRLIYVLTPLRMEVLRRVNAFVYAETLPDCCGVLSAPHLESNVAVPYSAPTKGQETSKHKHLHQIPKRKFNPLRLLEMGRKSQK